MEPSDERAGYCGGEVTEVRSILAQIRVAQIRVGSRLLASIIHHTHWIHDQLFLFSSL